MTDTIIADVSEFQDAVGWDAYATQTGAAIARACYGNSRVDLQWRANQAAMRARLKVRGYYAYIVAGQDIPSQADLFCRLVGPLQPGEVAIADIEEGAGDQSGRAAQWGQIVHSRIGGPNPWDYSGVWFDQAHNLGRIAWLAGYQQREPTLPHILWQFTNQQRFPGISSPCDASIFHGTVDQLYGLISPSTPVPQGARMVPKFQPPVTFEGMVDNCPWVDPTTGQVTGWLVLGVNGGVENLGAAPYLGSPEENKDSENWAAGGRKGAQILQHLDRWGYIVKSTSDTDLSPGYNYRVAGH